MQSHSLLLQPDEGRNLWWGDILVTFKVTKDQTDGAFTVMEDRVPPGYATPLHVHSREDERIYVSSGELTFRVGEETFEVFEGSFINMPLGLPHNFVNIGKTEAVLLVTFNPAGIEEMFYEMGRPVTDLTSPPPAYTPEDIKRIMTIANRYGVEILPPNR